MKRNKRKQSLRSKRVKETGFPNKGTIYFSRKVKENLWYLITELCYQDAIWRLKEDNPVRIKMKSWYGEWYIPYGVSGKESRCNKILPGNLYLRKMSCNCCVEGWFKSTEDMGNFVDKYLELFNYCVERKIK